MRLTKFLTRDEAAELNRRLKRAGYRSTAERCYDYVANIVAHFGKDAKRILEDMDND